MLFFSHLNFWDEAWWFLSLRVFGLLSSSLLLFPQRFSQYVLQPFSDVCRTRETFTELQTTSFIESTGVACSDSVSHNRVQVLSIPEVLVLYIWKFNILLIALVHCWNFSRDNFNIPSSTNTWRRPECRWNLCHTSFELHRTTLWFYKSDICKEMLKSSWLDKDDDEIFLFCCNLCCNGTHHRKWTRKHEFKSCTRLFAFHIVLIALRKVWTQTILPSAMGK